MSAYERSLAIADAAGRRQSRRHRLPKPPGGQPQPHRPSAVGDRQAGRGAGVVPAGAGDRAEAGRRQPRRHRVPKPPGGHTTSTSACCSRQTGRPGEALESYRRALAIQQKLADDNPAVTDFRSSLAASHNNIGILQIGDRQASRGAGVVPAGAGDQAEAGRRQPRRHQLPQQPCAHSQQHRQPAVADRQAGRGAGVVPAGAGDPAEAGRRQPRRHHLPKQPGGRPQQHRQSTVADWQVWRGVGVVPAGAGDRAETDRREPQRP